MKFQARRPKLTGQSRAFLLRTTQDNYLQRWNNGIVGQVLGSGLVYYPKKKKVSNGIIGIGRKDEGQGMDERKGKKNEGKITESERKILGKYREKGSMKKKKSEREKQR